MAVASRAALIARPCQWPAFRPERRRASAPSRAGNPGLARILIPSARPGPAGTFSRRSRRQMRRAPGRGNNHLQAPPRRARSVVRQKIGRAMGRNHLDLVRHLQSASCLAACKELRLQCRGSEARSKSAVKSRPCDRAHSPASGTASTVVATRIFELSFRSPRTTFPHQPRPTSATLSRPSSINPDLFIDNHPPAKKRIAKPTLSVSVFAAGKLPRTAANLLGILRRRARWPGAIRQDPVVARSGRGAQETYREKEVLQPALGRLYSQALRAVQRQAYSDFHPGAFEHESSDTSG